MILPRRLPRALTQGKRTFHQQQSPRKPHSQKPRKKGDWINNGNARLKILNRIQSYLRRPCKVFFCLYLFILRQAKELLSLSKFDRFFCNACAVGSFWGASRIS